MSAQRFAAVLLLALGLPSCLDDLDAAAPPPALDEPFFHCRVQPVLTKNCSAFLCHGDPQRYFRVYARNRLRLGGTEETRNGFLREEERAFNFASARAFVTLGQPNESLLLRKVLDPAAGGDYHGGAEEYGQGNVFESQDDSEFKTLVLWVQGQTEDPTCSEPGSEL